MAATDTPLATMLEDLLGTDLPVAIRAYDGSRLGPPEDEAPATIVVRSPDALRRIVTAPGELGFGRAYVAGDLDVEGDIYDALTLRDAMPRLKLSAEAVGGRSQAHRARRPEAAAARRPRRRACAVDATARSATPPRSRTTTTCRTSSTSSCSARR